MQFYYNQICVTKAYYYGALAWNTLSMQPQFHRKSLHETNKRYCAQDDGHQLHLISTSGKTLWNKKLGGKILGKINQIDFYKNKKLQLFLILPTVYISLTEMEIM